MFNRDHFTRSYLEQSGTALSRICGYEIGKLRIGDEMFLYRVKAKGCQIMHILSK